ncbi:CLUMA_CG021202, isoform A [Clunio marinus]|uniref:CLUMA_CG021202, isoform A n=1 Tax=Clunio marinus TaxID=568069 RepID=A0A1J1J810_9DIPT|nr:CLUMA_CG021202, isoform A [Clunio marinus]
MAKTISTNLNVYAQSSLCGKSLYMARDPIMLHTALQQKNTLMIIEAYEQSLQCLLKPLWRRG